ncbi:TRAP transporter small permease [Halomonas korlensis]|uniref:TRAP transporter small permease protein n=1 Tax=Halomonas korlensis TaxID=463301 RepID=A0A1I7J7M9_9GAMM|nr:TRAP transporter small permease subunit [Halomonas korlensis]SFU81210.1 TRAP-type C4-dicarboxylate transport system, small permease component [Halomonas korlensis]
MAAIFQSFQRLAARVFAGGAGLCMAMIFLIIFLNAVGRYTLGSSLAWGDQVPVFLGIYGVMFGMALAYLQDRHVRLGVIVDFLSIRLREALFLLVDLAVVLIGAVLAWSGYLFMSSRGGMRISGLNSTIRSLQEATGLEVFNVFGTMAPYQFAIVLGGGMLAVAAALKFIERLGALRATTGEVP